jgi:hypothetical protein
VALPLLCDVFFMEIPMDDRKLCALIVDASECPLRAGKQEMGCCILDLKHHYGIVA